MRVYVVDDDRDLGPAVARSIQRAGYDSTALASATAFFDVYSPKHPSCVVTDVTMPEIDGFSFAQALRQLDPAAAIIFMTAWPSTSSAVDAVRRFSGLDYLEKPLDEDRLLRAVEEGLEWSARRKAAWNRLTSLTAREQEVFWLLAQGLTNKAVAIELSISPKTVEDHRASILAKTGSSSIAQLISLARELA